MKKTQTLEAETTQKGMTATIGEEQVLKLMKDLRTEVEGLDRLINSQIELQNLRNEQLNVSENLITRYNTTNEILKRLKRIFEEVKE